MLDFKEKSSFNEKRLITIYSILYYIKSISEKMKKIIRIKTN